MQTFAAKRSVARSVLPTTGRKTSPLLVGPATPAALITPGRVPAELGAIPVTALQPGSSAMTTKAGIDLTHTVRELLALAKEQGHLSYDDIDEALADTVVSPKTSTRSTPSSTTSKSRLSTRRRWTGPKNPSRKTRRRGTDSTAWMIPCGFTFGRWANASADPRTGSTICKRIEVAQIEQKRIIYSSGIAAKEHIALAEN